jgi:MSHA biogenesis protein MshP
MRPEPSRQRGFSLPVAVFIITVLALIGTAMIQLVETGQASTSAEVQSIRAFYSAETGAQEALHALFPLDGSAGSCSDFSSAYSGNGLDGCGAEVTCTTLTAGSQTYYVINSTGTCAFGAAANAARRRVEVMAKGP